MSRLGLPKEAIDSEYHLSKQEAIRIMPLINLAMLSLILRSTHTKQRGAHVADPLCLHHQNQINEQIGRAKHIL